MKIQVGNVVVLGIVLMSICLTIWLMLAGHWLFALADGALLYYFLFGNSVSRGRRY